MVGRRTVLGGALALALVGLVGAHVVGTSPTARADGLVPFDRCDALVDHYRTELKAQRGPGFGFEGAQVQALSMNSGKQTVSADAASGSEAVGPGDTGTNVQEGGVDEPDSTKLKDGRIVTVFSGRLSIATADAAPRLVGTVRVMPRDRGDSGELLLVGNRAIVVGNSYQGYASDMDRPSSGFAGESPTTTVTLVDLTVPESPRVLEKVAYDGSYVSARLAGDTVRVVTTHTPKIRWAYPERSGQRAEREAHTENARMLDTLAATDLLPQRYLLDPATGEPLQGPTDGPVSSGPPVACADLHHAPGARGAQTVLVTTLRPGEGLAATDTTAVTTSGDMVYAAKDRLYLATSRWSVVGPGGPADSSTMFGGAATSTELHAFDTSTSGATDYVASGSVPGYLVNRWALSRYNDVLRVATTLAGAAKRPSESMVLTLDEQGSNLVESGRVSGLGRTEQIKSVRYLGDVAAVVTFRQTDPLYLVDLAGAPKVLGELKVPGFSTYLHPIGGDLLLGIGQDADGSGRVTGLQMSVFDASDRRAPRLVDRLSLGSGWSTALNESRAFSYDPSRRTAVVDYFDQRGRPDVIGVQVGTDGVLRETGRAAMDRSYYDGRVLIGAGRYFAVGAGAGAVTAVDPMTMTETMSVQLGK